MKLESCGILRIDKPWGHEIVWARTERYVGKILVLRAGEAMSLQYHRVKDETIRVLSGRLRLSTSREGGALEDAVLGPGEGMHIPAGMHHRMEALEACEILEVSTPELDDVVRLDDRYGRAPRPSTR